jgi:Concanavalin A-like lectin/glucanases superfamily
MRSTPKMAHTTSRRPITLENAAGTNCDLATGIVANTNQWYHLSGVFDDTANTLTLYVDGVRAASEACTLTVNTNALEVRIGDDEHTNGVPWDGKIDDVRIYNYARTPGQIAWDYNRGKPVGWWKFDECQGSTNNDSSGNTYNQTITAGSTTLGSCTTSSSMWGGSAGDSTTNSGKYNYALTLNGTDNYASTSGTIMNAASQQTYTNTSWGGWFNPTTGVASKTLLEKNREFRLTTDSSSNPACSIWTAGNWSTAAVSSTAFSLSSWQHILCTYDGTNIKVYLNGIQTGTTSQTASITSLNYTPLTSGHNFAGSAYYSGRIDDMRVYNYALTAIQIRTLYNEDSAIRFGPAAGSP